MGTKERREREKEKRRKVILEATSELFLEKGYDSTTMADIAHRVELSPGALYKYFKNKEELYASINLLGTLSILTKIEKSIREKSLTPEQKIIKIKEAMYKSLLSESLAHKTIVRILSADTLPTLSNELREQIKDVTRKILHIIADIYQDGVVKGSFEKRNHMAVADIIWSMFLGVAILEEAKHRLDSKKDFIKSTLDVSFEILLNGIKKQDS